MRRSDDCSSVVVLMSFWLDAVCILVLVLVSWFSSCSCSRFHVWILIVCVRCPSGLFSLVLICRIMSRLILSCSALSGGIRCSRWVWDVPCLSRNGVESFSTLCDMSVLMSTLNRRIRFSRECGSLVRSACTRAGVLTPRSPLCSVLCFVCFSPVFCLSAIRV